MASTVGGFVNRILCGRGAARGQARARHKSAKNMRRISTNWICCYSFYRCELNWKRTVINTVSKSIPLRPNYLSIIKKNYKKEKRKRKKESTFVVFSDIIRDWWAEERGESRNFTKGRFIFRSEKQRHSEQKIKSTGVGPLHGNGRCIHGNVSRFRLITSSFLDS